MTIDIPDDPSLGSGYVRSVPPRFPFFPFFPVRPGRRWGASSAACLLALGLALQFGTGTAEAQINFPPINPKPPVSAPPAFSVGKLIGNTGKSRDALINLQNDFAQAFTTGNHASGYVLTRADIAFTDAGGSPTYTVSIHSDSSGSPGSSLATLTNPASLTANAPNTFTNSGSRIELDAGTKYWLVLDLTGGQTTAAKISITDKSGEDAGGAAGWSIANNSFNRQWNQSAWTEEPNFAGRIAIHGYEKGSAGGAVTGNTLALTFGVNIKRVPVSGGLAKHFTVKVAGRKVPVTGVSVSGKTVTLTLARPAGANQAVTVSYNNAGTPLQSTSGNPVASFTDLTVENLSTNNAPVFTGTAPAPAVAPPATEVRVRVLRSDFSDPDHTSDNPDPLTFSYSADRGNVLTKGGSWPSNGIDHIDAGLLYIRILGACRLGHIPALPLSFDTVVTVTATDSHGAAASIDVTFETDRGGLHCPAFSSASVTDRALTVMFEGHADNAVSGLRASEFEVKVDGEVVPLADTDPITIGEPTTTGTRKTTPVTLNLSRPVGRGQTVTVSHVPYDADPTTTEDDLQTVGFTDEAVTVSSTNNAPTVTPSNPYNAPRDIAVYVDVADEDSDRFPEGHPSYNKKLHVTWTTDRPDLLGDGNAGYIDPTGQDQTGQDQTGQFYLRMPGECELAEINRQLPADQKLSPLFETTVRITAEDPTGAVARGTVLARTAWDGGDGCPLLAAAVTNGETLTLYFSVDLDDASVPPADRFTVMAGGDVVALASTGPVAVNADENSVVLTLADAVPAGSRVTVSYDPPVFGGIRGAGAYAAAGFTDEPVRNVAGDTRKPVLRSAWVEGTTLTLIYDELLHPLRKAGPSYYFVTEIADDGQGYQPAVTAVEVVGKRVVLTLGRAVNTNRDVVLIYQLPTDPADRIQDLAGNLADTLGIGDGGDQPVRHGSPPPERAPTSPSGGGGSPGDTAPDFGTATVAPLTLARGEAMEPVVLPEATGGYGDLTYTLASAPAGLAGLSFNAATRRLSGTPDAAGEYGFTYTVHDADTNRADSDAAVLTFTVTVEDSRTAMVRQSVRRTLSAVARRSLTSALDNIGARFAASVPVSGLTLAGETVPLGATTATGLTDTGTSRFCSPGSPGATDRYGTYPENCALVTRGMTSEELLHGSSFTLALGAAGGAENTGNTGMTGTPPSPQWAVWGRGDLGTFAGRPEPGMGYEGELRTGWLGVDARSGAWVAGLALSHGTGEADYDFMDGGVSGQGRLETSLTALYPYGRWTLSEGLEVRGVLGAGSGEARHRLDGGERETSERSDLSMWMGSVGLRRAFPSLGEIDLAARADASLARMETGDGPAHEHIANLTADSWRLRAGVEASRRFALDGDAALEPFVEAAARRDGGDGLEGTGLEIAGGVRYTAPRLHIEMRGRWLASHSEEGAEESGVSVTARMGPGARGRGLSLSLSPRWGAGTGGAEALWRDELPGPAGSGGTAAMDARIGYGFSWAPYGLDGWNGLLTPFAETGISGQSGNDSRRLRLGARFEASRMNLGVELAGERRENGTSEPEHALRLDLGLRF